MNADNLKVKFYTLGCKVNQYETQALQEEFLSKGCSVASANADLCIINTCTVTRRADKKSREIILRAKRNNPNAKIAVCGCMASGDINSVKLGVDYVIAQKEKQFVADIILDNPLKEKDIWALKIKDFSNHRAFIKIQDGCNNQCSFCKIPYVRGTSHSRPQKDILEEIKTISLFHKEIVLCGINLGLYGKDLTPSSSLYELLDKILALNLAIRIRLSSLEPALFDRRIFKQFYDKRLCPHLHFPFQSGDDKVLKAMNKKENVALYQGLVDKLREINPLFAISCDMMVGCPCEGKDNFESTVNFLNRIKPMRTHIFTFSPRENTAFYKKRLINRTIAEQRKEHLKKITDQLALEYKKKCLGKTWHMIAEEEKEGCICGYSQNYLKIYLKEKVALGQIYPVKAIDLEKDKVFAKLINKKS